MTDVFKMMTWDSPESVQLSGALCMHLCERVLVDWKLTFETTLTLRNNFVLLKSLIIYVWRWTIILRALYIVVLFDGF